MRVGIFLPKAFRPYSIDLEGYAAELSRLGHEPVLVCPSNEHPDFPLPVCVHAPGETAQEGFWRNLRLDRVIALTWFGQTGVFLAIRASGALVVNRADSDGLVSARIFPAAAWMRLVDPSRGPVDFIRRLRHFLNWYLSHWRAHDAAIIANLSASDRVVVETGSFLRNFERFLIRHRRSDLLSKFSVVPHSVPDLFLAPGIAGARPRRIFCSGRWDDDQKNAPLMAAVVRRMLEIDPGVEFVLAGFGVHEAFRSLRGLSRVSQIGLVDRSALPGVLAGCRFLLSSSRWESHPIGALEALCTGCTAVATPVPGFADIVQGGRYGTLALSHSASALANAAARELSLWDARGRDPVGIASHWRNEVSNKKVVSQLLNP